MKSPGDHLIPVKDIAARLVYTKCKMDFGTSIRDDLVYIVNIVIPLQSADIHDR